MKMIEARTVPLKTQNSEISQEYPLSQLNKSYPEKCIEQNHQDFR